VRLNWPVPRRNAYCSCHGHVRQWYNGGATGEQASREWLGHWYLVTQCSCEQVVARVSRVVRALPARVVRALWALNFKPRSCALRGFNGRVINGRGPVVFLGLNTSF
jgi:hypothetical protein